MGTPTYSTKDVIQEEADQEVKAAEDQREIQAELDADEARAIEDEENRPKEDD